MSTPTILPLSFHAGDTIQWGKDIADYPPADGWTLKYAFVSPTQRILVTGTEAEGLHAVEISAAVSETMLPSDFSYQGYVEILGGERHTVDTGSVEVLANFADQSNGYDARNHVQKVIAAIEAVIEGRASSAQESRKVGDRELKYIPMADLLTLRDQYKSELYELDQDRKRLEGEIVNKNIGFMFTR